MKNKQKGFSLIELLIVVVIIGIIAAIAVPNMMASRIAANEGSALASMRILHGAQAAWLVTNGNGSYTSDLTKLSDAKMVDTLITDSINGKSGYKFSAKTSDANSNPKTFVIGARPVSTVLIPTGRRRFCIATEGVFNTYTDTEGGDPTRGGSSAACEPFSEENGGSVL